MLTAPTLDQLADFSGRPQASYPAFATSALKQATFLMQLRTCLVSLPADPAQAQLMLYGILELSDDIVLKQPYREITAKPFTSETLMSYAYSKAAVRAQEGKKTGLMWFDLAVQKLSVCEDDADISSAAITIFENDGVTVDGEGRSQVLGPAGTAESFPLWTNPDNYGR